MFMGLVVHLLPMSGIRCFRQLAVRGYIKVDADNYGAIKLEQKCRPLLRGEEAIQLRKDKPLQRTKPRPAKVALPKDIDPALWERLREQRKRLATAQGGAALYHF